MLPKLEAMRHEASHEKTIRCLSTPIKLITDVLPPYLFLLPWTTVLPGLKTSTTGTCLEYFEAVDHPALLVISAAKLDAVAVAVIKWIRCLSLQEARSS